jgi:hypothetical protein
MRVTLIKRAHLLTLAVALTAGLVLVSLAITTTLSAKTTHKSQLPGNPPTFVLMRGTEVIQKGRTDAYCWHYWKEYPDSVEERKDLPPPSKWANREGYWTGVCITLAIRKKTDLYPRNAVLVPPGSTLHIRIGHHMRPDRVQLIEGLNWGRTLDYSLKRVKRDDETVAWDVFFRVKRPESHYYLHISADWERVPGRHISHGDNGRFFHVKTH